MLRCTVALAALPSAMPPDASRQAQSERNPPEAPSSGGFPLHGELRPVRSGRSRMSLDVVAAALEIGEQSVECRPLHHVGTIVWAGTIPDRDQVTQIGGYLHAPAVRIARLGLTPDGTRQVSHHYSSRSASCFRYWAVSFGSRAASTARSNASM